MQAQTAAMLENPAGISQFIPPQNYEMDKGLKYPPPPRDPTIFNDDEPEKGKDDGSDDDDDDEDDEDLNSIPDDDQDDDTNQDEEYDDSEEAEEEDYPYANSDPEEQATNLKNGQSIGSSQSSPKKDDNGESKIEKFA